MSGLTHDLYEEHSVYAIHDGFFQQSRIYKLDTRHHLAVISAEIVLVDSLGKLAATAPALVNADGSVNLDAEGISSSANGGFWIASEGAGSDVSANLLVHVDAAGEINEVVTLPDASAAQQQRFGFEGVASVGAGDREVLFVAFQREWRNDPTGYARIGRYDIAAAEWRFYYYPLDKAQSPNGGWVGLSEISALGPDEFAVIERDNQANSDARIKRLYKFSVSGMTALPEPQAGAAPSFPLLDKVLVQDLLPALKASGGMALEKIEGMTVAENGDVLIVNDNDGVEGSNGETQLLRLQGLMHY
nr:esterase-like activity of phytase family protein [Methylomarinum sp. Ch1-1]MDP4520574.1 esterase-like activity of phytase family protein [Methylomarinum sp. Ch1-1]